MSTAQCSLLAAAKHHRCCQMSIRHEYDPCVEGAGLKTTFADGHSSVARKTSAAQSGIVGQQVECTSAFSTGRCHFTAGARERQRRA